MMGQGCFKVTFDTSMPKAVIATQILIRMAENIYCRKIKISE